MGRPEKRKRPELRRSVCDRRTSVDFTSPYVVAERRAPVASAIVAINYGPSRSTLICDGACIRHIACGRCWEHRKFELFDFTTCKREIVAQTLGHYSPVAAHIVELSATNWLSVM